jgi:hypothetical protein
MNICCSGVQIILINKILRTKLLRQLMTFLTVQLLFDKLRHTFLMLLFCRTYLTRNFLKHTLLKIKIIKKIKKFKQSKNNYIQGVAQLTPQRKLTCADSNNITGKTDSFFLSAFLIDLEAYQIHQSR